MGKARDLFKKISILYVGSLSQVKTILPMVPCKQHKLLNSFDPCLLLYTKTLLRHLLCPLWAQQGNVLISFTIFQVFWWAI